MTKLRISGIYNPETVQNLLSHQIDHLGFDQRPKSMNFIQGHILEECLQEINSPDSKLYIHFLNEKDFVINALIERATRLGKKTALVLEFSDELTRDFYDSFKLPYLWHFKKEVNYHALFESSYLETVSLDNELLIEIETEGNLFSFLNELKNICETYNKKIELSLNWNSDISSSLLDFFYFDTIHFSINALVEKSYREVDQQLLHSSLVHTKTVLNLE